MIDLYSTYLQTVPWGALFGSPFGNLKKPNHNRRLIIHYDGENMSAGGFVINSFKPGGSAKAEFAFRKKASPTQWFVDNDEEIPKPWRKEHVSFFTGSRIFNMSCVTSSLPNTTSLEVVYAPDHPMAINISRWADTHQANLHYCTIASLELALQWYHTRQTWKNERDLKFILGNDGSQWFLAGACSNGLCAFHQMDHPFELAENVNGFYVTLNPDIFSEMSLYAPGREDEASDIINELKDNYFPELKIDKTPFNDLTLTHAPTVTSQPAATFLSSFIPRRISHV